MLPQPVSMPEALMGTLAADPQCRVLSVPLLPNLTREVGVQPCEFLPISRLPPSKPKSVLMGPILARTLETRWACYREQLRRCQRKFSEDAVHELRVATRRLIALFTLLGCIVPSTELEKAQRLLKRRRTALGELRDAQVQRVFIESKTAAFPELLLLRRWLRRHERWLARSAAGIVKRCKTRKLERWIVRMIEKLSAGAGSCRTQTRLANMVLRATARAYTDAVERRNEIDLADLRTIHQTRVAFKRFRYKVEVLSPELTGLSKRQLRALAYYQRKMGIIQDLEVMQAGLKRYLRRNPEHERLFRRFGRYLQQRRARALRSFLKSADRLYGFWPPARLAPRYHAAPTQTAA